MMKILSMETLDLHNKRVIIRVDLNVPMDKGKILNDARIRAILPTLQLALKKGARILVISHLGRPQEGVFSEEYSLRPIADYLAECLQYPVRFEKDWLAGTPMGEKEIVLGENVRFNQGEEANDVVLAKKMAALCDVFIMDAFGTAHRAQASTVGIAKFAPIAAGGLLLLAELKALKGIFENPKRPWVAIVGGAKISSKLFVLKSLIDKVDTLILGGGIANTFCAAQGTAMGQSLFESEKIAMAKEYLSLAKEKGVDILLPEDVIVATEISATAKTKEVLISEVKANEKILDVGSKTIQRYSEILLKAGTILWNGPVGVFELEPFSRGTEQLSQAIAASKAYSVAGGGETVAAIEKYGVGHDISYISTGGGAFLEYLEGKILPAVAILEERFMDEKT